MPSGPATQHAPLLVLLLKKRRAVELSTVTEQSAGAGFESNHLPSGVNAGTGQPFPPCHHGLPSGPPPCIPEAESTPGFHPPSPCDVCSGILVGSGHSNSPAGVYRTPIALQEYMASTPSSPIGSYIASTPVVGAREFRGAGPATKAPPVRFKWSRFHVSTCVALMRHDPPSGTRRHRVSRGGPAHGMFS